MNLEILSFDEALRYEPDSFAYAIRIFSTHKDNLVYSMTSLCKKERWVGINNYFFDDVWPKGYDAFDYNNFKEAEKIFFKENFFGGVYGREIIFDEGIAKKIQEDYENVSESVEDIMIHCMKGQNRSPAIGIAMNEIYGWGIEGLKKEFPYYRKWIYDLMIEVAKKKGF